MPNDNIASIDERVLRISGGDKLKLLLAEQAGSVRNWARKHGFDSTEVYYTLNGTRPYPEIRRKIARSLKIGVADVDRLIGGASVTEPESASV